MPIRYLDLFITLSLCLLLPSHASGVDAPCQGPTALEGPVPPPLQPLRCLTGAPLPEPAPTGGLTPEGDTANQSYILTGPHGALWLTPQQGVAQGSPPLAQRWLPSPISELTFALVTQGESLIGGDLHRLWTFAEGAPHPVATRLISGAVALPGGGGIILGTPRGLLCLRAGDLEAPPTSVPGTMTGVRAIAVGQDALYAGTKSGALYQLPLGESPGCEALGPLQPLETKGNMGGIHHLALRGPWLYIGTGEGRVYRRSASSGSAPWSFIWGSGNPANRAGEPRGLQAGLSSDPPPPILGLLPDVQGLWISTSEALLHWSGQGGAVQSIASLEGASPWEGQALGKVDLEDGSRAIIVGAQALWLTAPASSAAPLRASSTALIAGGLALLLGALTLAFALLKGRRRP